MTQVQYDGVQRTALIGLVGNIVLTIFKGLIGWIAGSRGLMAEAIHSATDVVGSLAVIFGVRAAHAPPDEEHPYGHGKAESIAAIIVAMLIAGVGLEASLVAIDTLLGPVSAPTWLAVVGSLVAIAIKESLYRYTSWSARRLNSHLLRVKAWDHRADVISTAAVLLGIAGSIAGEHFRLGLLLYLDPVAGLLVSLYVIYIAYRLARTSIGQALDRVLDKEQTIEMGQLVAQVDGVLAVDRLLARQHGHYVIVDLKIAVDPTLTVCDGHKIGKAVKHSLMEHFGNISDVLVHVNPYFAGEKHKC